MDEELIRVRPDKERAGSILKMVKTLLERIETTDRDKFTSLIVSDYYEIFKELITAVLLLDGYKTLSHKALVEYSRKFLDEEGVALIDQLRTMRNRINYEGFFVELDYLSRKEKEITSLINKLIKRIEEKF
jgi:hypothetical protein